VGLSVSVRAPDYGPGAGAAVKAELVDEDGHPGPPAEAVAGPDGVAHLELTPPGPGAYKVVASARPGCGAAPCPADAPVVEATGAVAVRAAGPEDLDAAPRPELLRAVAEATGGAFSSGDRLPEVRLAEPDVVEIGRRKDVPIWDRAAFLFGLVLCLSAEWVLRRRWGYW